MCLATAGTNGAAANAASTITLRGEVIDDDGQPVTDALVIAIQKTWPGGRFQMKSRKARTNEKGQFEFSDFASKGQPYAYLCAALPDGHSMVSLYRDVRDGATPRRLRLRVDRTRPTSVKLTDRDGNPLVGVRVLPTTRVTAAGKEHIAYPVQLADGGKQTDRSGVVKWSAFAPGDKVTFTIDQNGNKDQHTAVVPATQTMTLSIASMQGDPNASPQTPPKQSASKMLGQVLDTSGAPIASAKVLIIHKSWPNRRFQQRASVSKTNATGEFDFPESYDANIKNALLVTILADGYAMESKYRIFTPGQATEGYTFKLASAQRRQLRFVNAGNKPLSNTKVFLSRRKAADQEHLIFATSGSDATWTTNQNGELTMTVLQPGDQVTFLLPSDNGAVPVTATLDDSTSQTIMVSRSVGIR